MSQAVTPRDLDRPNFGAGVFVQQPWRRPPVLECPFRGPFDDSNNRTAFRFSASGLIPRRLTVEIFRGSFAIPTSTPCFGATQIGNPALKAEPANPFDVERNRNSCDRSSGLATVYQ
jgi:hypothetical protein